MLVQDSRTAAYEASSSGQQAGNNYYRWDQMKQFIDYIPLLIFFTVFAIDERTVSIGGFEHSIGGIFSAAEFLLAASILTYGSLFLLNWRLDKFQWITLCAVILFCIPTIIFRNTDFLKWKAPIVNWIFALVFFGSRYFGSKLAIEHMLGHVVNAPKEVWRRLNNIWVIYFIILGAVNLIIAFTLSERAWIQFKVFGNLISTFVFVIGQMPLLAKYIEVDKEDTESKSSCKESV